MKPVILFIDDEPNILRGLRRFTRLRRDAWDMHFVESGYEAIKLMEKMSVDVVVSDMRMPEMTGADLLEHISQKAPGIIRIILSGEAEREQTYRTVGRSHRFLAKPCDPDILISAIDSPLLLRSMLSYNQAVASAFIYDKLKSPAIIFDELTSILEEQAPSTEALVKVVRSDPNLAARILQIVNSAYFGRPLTTCNITQAVGSIGVDNLRNLLVRKRLGNGKTNFSDENYHSLISYDASQLAVEAAGLAKEMGANAALIEDVYAAGLFANLGSLQPSDTNIKETNKSHSSMRAAYITTLLGLPKLLGNTFLSMLDLKGDATISEISNRICNALVSEARQQ